MKRKHTYVNAAKHATCIQPARLTSPLVSLIDLSKSYYHTLDTSLLSIRHKQRKYNKARQLAGVPVKNKSAEEYVEDKPVSKECIDMLDIYINKYRHIIDFDWKTLSKMRQTIAITQEEIANKESILKNLTQREYLKHLKHLRYFEKKYGYTTCAICKKEILKFREDHKYCKQCFRLHTHFIPKPEF